MFIEGTKTVNLHSKVKADIKRKDDVLADPHLSWVGGSKHGLHQKADNTH